jgi:DnaJ-domain-containing protein 1
VGVIEAIRKIYLWLARRSVRVYSNSSQTSHDTSQDLGDETALRWEEALQLVLMLDAYRWDAGLPPDWLDGQCASFPLLSDALTDLRRRGLIKPGARHTTSGFSPDAGIPPQGDPHRVLGVPRGASHEEIRKAYREQMKRYHPDRLQQFGPEFTRLAEEKTKLLQWAYGELTRTI